MEVFVSLPSTLAYRKKGLLSDSGEVLQSWSTLLEAGVADGDTLTAVVQPAKVSATRKAFAIWFSNGPVIYWGHPKFGGDAAHITGCIPSPQRADAEKLIRVQQIESTGHAFAALLADGSAAWPELGTSDVEHSLPKNLAAIVLAHYICDAPRLKLGVTLDLAVTAQGFAIDWHPKPRDGKRLETDRRSSTGFGRPQLFGSTFAQRGSGVQADLHDVDSITGSLSAFCALKRDGSVVCWGDDESGGEAGEIQQQLKHATWRSFVPQDITDVEDQLKEVQQIASTSFAFAAVLADGSVVAWGDPFAGGNCRAVEDELRTAGGGFFWAKEDPRRLIALSMREVAGIG
eukprot:Skav216585  [mRNA]  locus=scaffold3151:128822:135176:+ [translate_table: standard]